MKQARAVSAHMTAATQAIGPDCTLADAQQRMRERMAPQLPVVDEAGQPCGMLLERDLHIAKQLGAAFDRVTVGSLIPRNVFSVKADEPLASAVRAMASRAAANAIVLEGAQVGGILTSRDILRLVAELLEAEESAERPAERTVERAADQDVARDETETTETTETEAEDEADATRIRPVQGRTPEGVPLPAAPDVEVAAVSAEQSGCSLLDESYLLERIEDFAGKLLQDESEADAEELGKTVRELYDVQAALLASEQKELAVTRPEQEPLHRTRLEQLSEERARHAQALATLLLELNRGTTPTAAIAGHALQVTAALRAYIEREREPLRFVS